MLQITPHVTAEKLLFKSWCHASSSWCFKEFTALSRPVVYCSMEIIWPINMPPQVHPQAILHCERHGANK